MSKRSGSDQLAKPVSRIHRGGAFWRSALKRQQASGLAQREFCEREGLAASTFALWSKRLATADAQATPVQFIEVRPGAQHAASASNTDASLRIRLDLGGGIALEIVRS